jgi:hypothetical protein
VEQLHLEDGACALGGPQLADQIMSVLGAAQVDMSDRVTDAVAATVGADTETGRAVLSSFRTRFLSAKPSDHNPGVGEDHDSTATVVHVSVAARDGR